MAGFVSLVGAGPGDPELLTMKAVRRLGEAELVLHDALVSEEVLALAGSAQRFLVGKRAGRRSMKQHTIHQLMVRAYRRGEKVVRLKCGDPFVFGRGGEEALALVDAEVPFEVVPGVSAALAGPLLAGIPVTHRGLSSGFVVLSGHSPEAYGTTLDALPPHSLTLVVMMGLNAREGLTARLLQRGWSPHTPAAVCFAASTPRARTWLGTLEALPRSGAGEDDAGTVVIGEVAGLAGALGPSATLPRNLLQGAF